MFAVNCKANLHLLRKALPTFNANSDGGVFLLTASVAGVGVGHPFRATFTLFERFQSLETCLASIRSKDKLLVSIRSL
jgi:hypothetical protein